MSINVNLQILPIETVRPNPWNPNKQSDFIFTKEVESIKEHGFIDPITVRQKDGFVEIIDGEHRWRGAQKAGLMEIPVNNLGVVADEVAKRLTIIANETRGAADKDDLAKLISDLHSEIGMEALARSLPYTDGELKFYLSQATIDWDKVSANLPTATTDETKVEDGEITFQIRLSKEMHDRLYFELNRIKMQLAPGQDPQGIRSVDALEQMLRHISRIPDDRLLS